MKNSCSGVESIIVKVLIADDLPAHQTLARKVLSCLSVDIKTADDGLEALVMWRKWQPDLILMDYRMPVMDGVEATAQIRLEERSFDIGHTPVFLVTSGIADIPDHNLHAIFDEIIIKPYTPTRLILAVTTLASTLSDKRRSDTVRQGNVGARRYHLH